MAIHGALLWFLSSQHLEAPAPFTGQECSRDWHCSAKPFSVSAVKRDRAAQASSYRLNLPASNDASNKPQRKASMEPGTPHGLHYRACGQ